MRMRATDGAHARSVCGDPRRQFAGVAPLCPCGRSRTRLPVRERRPLPAHSAAPLSPGRVWRGGDGRSDRAEKLLFFSHKILANIYTVYIM